MEIRPGAIPEPITQDVTSPRQTTDGGERFRAALEAGAEGLVSGAANAAAGVPGVPLLSAAIRGGADGTTMPSTESAEAPAVGTEGAAGSSDMASVIQQSQEFNLYYLQIQEEMSQENRRFSALSNVMKARHETSKTAIGNIR